MKLVSGKILYSLLMLLAWPMCSYANATNDELDCIINPSIVADLGSNVPGVIDSIKVDRSDFIAQGEKVAMLNTSVERATVALTRVRANLTSEIEQHRINTALTRRQLERARGLFIEAAISSNSMDESETQAKLAELQLKQAQDNQLVAIKEFERASAELERRTIRAPFTGVVMESFKAIGEYIDDEAVIRLAQLDPLYVEVIAPVSQYGRIRPGQEADVRSVDTNGDIWQATVSRVDKVLDAASGTFGVRLTLPNPNHTIPAGLRCRVKFLAKENTDLNEVIPAPLTSISPLPESTAELDPLPQQTIQHDEPSNEELSGQIESPEPVIKMPEPINCTPLGPYDNAEIARTELNQLRDNGQIVTIDTTSQMEIAGYLVISPPLATQQEVKALIIQLKQVGQNDYQLFGNKGEPKRISMGLFRKKQGAEKRQAILNMTGIDSVIQPWEKQKKQYWLKPRCSTHITIVKPEILHTDNLVSKVNNISEEVHAP